MEPGGGQPTSSADSAYAVSEFRAAGNARPSSTQLAIRDDAASLEDRPPRANGWRELALGLAIFALYLVVTRRVQVSHAVADAHASSVLDLERALHIDVEEPLNRWLHGHSVLGALAAWEYATTYILTTFGFLGWLWWRRPAWYRWARGVLVTSTLIAIACFAFWPLTPPRLLHASGFFDVVAAHHPFLSWGSNTVSAGADQWAAMPSLHIGWAVWVTIASLRVGAGWLGRGLAGLHLAVTSYVVVATGNHFVVDIAAGVALVGVSMLVYLGWTKALAATGGAIAAFAPRRRGVGGRSAARGPQPTRLPAADAFFLHVESENVPQLVGGVAILDTSGLDTSNGGHVDIERVRRMVAERLPGIPQFRRRLLRPTTWRAARWQRVEQVDLRYHVRSLRAPQDSGRRGLQHVVARLMSRPMDDARPPWRLWLVRDVGPHEAAAVVLMHHCVGDGLGVVDLLRHLLDAPSATPAQLAALTAGPPAPPRWKMLLAPLATAFGVGQLAFDGRAQRLPFNGELHTGRVWRTLQLPLPRVRALAKAAGATVTDVLLSAFGDVLGDALRQRGVERRGQRLRVAVPVTLRRPGSAPGDAGNLTAAVRVDVPLDQMRPAQRLRQVHDGVRRRRRPARLLATTAVIKAIGALPPRLHRRAARAMYQSRFFGAIITNMPGPTFDMSFSDLPLKDVYPVIPLADGVPIAAGTLGWNGRLCLSVTAEPELLPEADDIDARLARALDELEADLDAGPAAEDHDAEAPVWSRSSA